ncbi:MAG TPA: hypothetical protein VNM68_03685 [Candidatus Polarisedimenticolia bacterium]|nr:hypothetical protein [Candidatus Polarisedimenticolia bacterium]
MKLLFGVLLTGGLASWFAINSYRPLDQTLAYALLGVTLLAGVAVLGWAAKYDNADDSDSYAPKPRYIAVSSVLWLFALAVFLNALLDRSAPAQHPTTVVSKREGTFGQSVTVNSWRQGRRVESIPVDSRIYPKLPESGSIVVSVKPGLLGIPWVSGFEHVYRLNLRNK